MSAATARAGVEVQYRATGVEAVKRAGREVTNSTTQMQQRVGAASTQIAGAIENIARQGKLTGEAMKQVASQGAQMAFMFGPQGAIFGAIAVLGVATWSYFDRTRREIAETTRIGIQEMERLARAGTAGLSEAAQRRFSGDPFARRGSIEGETDAQFIARRFGLQGVRGRIEELRGILPADIVAAGGRLGRTWSGATTTANQARELRELLQLLARLKPEHAEIMAMLSGAAAADVSRSRNLAAIEGAKKPGMPGAVNLPALSASAQLAALGPRAAVTGGIAVPDARNIADVIANDEVAQGIIAGAQRLAEVANVNIGMIVGEGVASGFARAFNGEGIKGLLAGFGQTVLSAIGSLFQQMGMAYLQFGKIMELSKLLFNPATAGFAGIALGVALMALGGALQGLAGGGGGRGMGGGYSAASTATTSVIDRGIINPLNPLGSTVTPRQPVTVNATIIGPNDPTAQRGIRELIRNAQARGSI